jgi:hypothetical protein
MLSSVAGEVSLPISFYVQPPDHPPALDRLLPNAGVYGLPSPLDVARKTHID